MPYYSAGDYYQAGDNYAAGAFPFIGAALALGKKLIIPAAKKLVTAIIKRPVTSAVTATGVGLALRPMPQPEDGYLPEPGLRGKVRRFLPGGETGFYKRRRMNVTNVRALRRAGRRVKGFLKLARRLGALPVGGPGRKLFKVPRRARCK